MICMVSVAEKIVGVESELKVKSGTGPVDHSASGFALHPTLVTKRQGPRHEKAEAAEGQ